MGNKQSSITIVDNALKTNKIAKNYLDLPYFTIERLISKNIMIGVNSEGSGIKYLDDKTKYFNYSILNNYNKYDDNIEYYFKEDSKLKIYKLTNSLAYSLYKYDRQIEGGYIHIKYKTINFHETPFDEIAKLQ